MDRSDDKACPALDELVSAERPAYALALRLTGSPEDAEDVVQQAYLNALGSLRGGPPPQEARTWFLTVVANVAKDHLKTSRRRAGREAAVPAHDVAADSGQNDELVSAIRSALGALDPESRALVTLCCEQGLSQREAARILDLPLSTLSDRLARGLEQLRKTLEAAGYAAAPAAVLGGLKLTAPVVPAGLSAFVKSLAAGGAAKTAGAATAAASSGMALGWKVAAAASLAALVGFGGHEVWKRLHPAAPAPVTTPVAAAPVPPSEKKLGITVIARGADAKAPFEELGRNNVRVVLLGRQRALIVPSDLRFKPVDGRELVEAVAKFHGIKVAWAAGGQTAILFRGAADKEMERFLADVKSDDAARRADAAWRARWIEDPRVVTPLVSAAIDRDAEVSRQAVRSLRRLTNWSYVLTLDAEAPIDALAAALGSRDVDARRQAAFALGQVGGDKALALLKKALGDGDANVRQNAVSALGHMRGEQALVLLGKALADQDWTIRMRAIEVLEQVGGEKAQSLVMRALEDQDGTVRGLAIHALGQAGGEKALALLERDLEDKQWHIRQGATWEMARFGGEKARVLFERLLQDKSVDIRRNGAEVLASNGGEWSFPLLEKAMEDSDRPVRVSAVKAMGRLGGEKGLVLLDRALNDKDVFVRGGAADALGHVNSEDHLALLAKALRNDYSPVRWSAADALGRIGSKNSVELLEKALEDKDSLVRGRVAFALGNIGNERSLVLLEKALEKENEGPLISGVVGALGSVDRRRALDLIEKKLPTAGREVRMEAAYVLASVGGEKAMGLLGKLLEDKDDIVRWQASAALNHADIDQALPLIRKALGDGDQQVRFQAVEALKKNGNNRALPVVEEALGDDFLPVRASAIGALVQIDGPGAVRIAGKALESDDINDRSMAASALGTLGGEKARDLLLKRLAEEKDRRVLAAGSRALRECFPDDPAVEKALKDFKLPDPPRPEPKPRPQPGPKPEPIPAPPETF